MATPGRWARAALGLLLALAGATVQAAGPDDVCERARPVEQAVRTVHHQGQVVETAAVSLPDRIPRAWRQPGYTLHYRIDLQPCPLGGERRTLLLSRIGGPYEIRADGRALDPVRHDSFGASPPFNGRIGGLFWLEPGTQRVEVQLVTVPNVAGGLIRVAEGPQSRILQGPARAWLHWLRFNVFVSSVLAAAGVLGLLLAATRPRSRELLWFAAACLVWVVRGQVLQLSGIPLAPLVYEQLNPLMLLLAALTVAASTLALTESLTARRGRALMAAAALVVAGFAASLATPALLLPFRTLAFVGGFAVLLLVAGLLLARFRRMRRSEALWLAAGYGAVMVGGGHDLAMILGLLPPGWWTLLTPGFATLLLTHLVAVSLYLLRSLTRAERANEELEDAIAAKSRELQESYQQRQSLELAHARDAARLQERERLLRDMHDGLGAQLMTALRGVERGALTPPQIAQALQDSLDELRLLMDSTDLGHFLPGALAAWRNRWDTRLLAAGMTLEWRIDASIDEVELPGDTTLQLMRILQEAAANALKHAQATQLQLLARVDAAPDGPAQLHIEIVDNGIGLHASAHRAGGRGLKNMRYRASRIGAVLEIGSPASGRGCRVQLRLPLGGAAADQATSPRRAASIAASARDEMPSLR